MYLYMRSRYMFSLFLQNLYTWHRTPCLEIISIYERFLYDCILIKLCTIFLMCIMKLSLTVSPQWGLPLLLPFYIYLLSLHESKKYFKTELQSFVGCINFCNYMNSFYVWWLFLENVIFSLTCVLHVNNITSVGNVL
jgi:hypothetical protein